MAVVDKDGQQYSREVRLTKTQLNSIRRSAESIDRLITRSLPGLSSVADRVGSLPRMKIPALDNIVLPSTLVADKAISDAAKMTARLAVFSSTPPLFNERIKALDRLMKSFSRDWFNQISEMAKSATKLVEKSLPPNWTEGQTLTTSIDNLDTLLLDEGLALAWVPPHSVVEKLFSANSAGQRRKIILNNSKGIVNACLVELKTIDNPDLKEHVGFAIKSAESMQAGYWESSQALSANLMESILRRMFDSTSSRKLTTRTERLNWKDYPIRSAVVFGGIWGAYATYKPGEVIPREYTRNASAHAVSNRQYTKTNALLALMHTTSLLKLVAEESQT